jgi:hypothetical protein
MKKKSAMVAMAQRFPPISFFLPGGSQGEVSAPKSASFSGTCQKVLKAGR